MSACTDLAVLLQQFFLGDDPSLKKAQANAIYQAMVTQGFFEKGAWGLVGTDGCHLCETVQGVYALLSQRFDVPKLALVELLELPMGAVNELAVRIPVLVTPDALLVYPFGLMDMQGLVR